MSAAIRPATEDDHDAILSVVRQAFSQDGKDAHEELDIVVNTWSLGTAVDGCELVAVHHDDIVGHVLGARGDLSGHDVVAVAPLAVSPARHGRGHGRALMEALVARADADGWPMVVLLGNPAYYGRFGFEPAGPLGIVYQPVGAENPAFQVRRLAAYDASLRGDFTYCWERSDWESSDT